LGTDQNYLEGWWDDLVQQDEDDEQDGFDQFEHHEEGQNGGSQWVGQEEQVHASILHQEATDESLKRLKLLAAHFKRYENPLIVRDGNCFFDAAADQLLRLLELELTHQEVKREALFVDIIHLILDSTSLC